MLFLDETPALTETDMQIYRVIVQDMDAVVYMRIRDLAAKTYCSTASIQRFCQKFKCTGWAEFKTKLRMYNLQAHHQGHLPHDIDGGEIIRAIAAVDDRQYQQQLRRAAHLLAERAQVLWLGAGTSKLVAAYGATTYTNSVNLAFTVDVLGSHPRLDYPEATLRNLAAVVCSVSGENQLILGYVNELIKHGVPIVAITNSDHSTLARLATVSLPYYVTPQHLNDTTLTSQAPAIYLIEKLTRQVMMLVRPEMAVTLGGLGEA